MTKTFLGYSTEGLTEEDVLWLEEERKNAICTGAGKFGMPGIIKNLEDMHIVNDQTTRLFLARVSKWLSNKPESYHPKVSEFIERYKDKEAPVNTVTDMLEERGARYGDFCGHAKITMDLKRAMHASKNWADLSDDKKECLDMVAHKIGRILNGDPEYLDSWQDCIGYLTLITNKLKG